MDARPPAKCRKTAAPRCCTPEAAMMSLRTLRRAGPFTRDILTALAVLALVFLNFAHSPGAVAYDAELRPYLVAQNSIACLSSDETRDHAPCEVCQLGGTALP